MGLGMTPDLKQMLDDQRERDKVQLSIASSLERIAKSLEQLDLFTSDVMDHFKIQERQTMDTQLILSNLLLLAEDPTNKINFLDALSTLQVFTERSY